MCPRCETTVSQLPYEIVEFAQGLRWLFLIAIDSFLDNVTVLMSKFIFWEGSRSDPLDNAYVGYWKPSRSGKIER